MAQPTLTAQFLQMLPLLLPLVALGGLGLATTRRACATIAPWLPALALLLQFGRLESLDLDSVLLGSRLLFDSTAITAASVAALLFLVTGTLNRRRLGNSPGEAAGFLLAWIGVLTLCLAGDLLLYLAGTAVAGYAMLVLSALSRRAITTLSAAALATMLLIGGLAMLELATLLVEAGASSFFDEAAGNLAAMRGELLVELCLILGYAGTVALALVAPIWLAGSSAPSLDKISLMPGWLAIGIGGLLGRARIEAQTAFEDGLAEWVIEMAWAVPLAVLLFFLPAILHVVRRWLLQIGLLAGRASAVIAGLPSKPQSFSRPWQRWIRDLEARLVDWTAATSLLVLVALVLVLATAWN